MSVSSVVYAVVLFGILIFVHEFGHFIVAKLTGMKVTKFSIGMGPKLIGKKYGETEYMFSAFPLGGYVKLYGDDPQEILDNNDQHRAFQNQPVYKRILVAMAGSVFNIVFAAAILYMLYLVGIPRMTVRVGEVMKDTPAMAAGIQKEDLIVSIDGKDVKYWEDMTDIIHSSPDKELSMTIERNGSKKVIHVKPERKKSKNLFGEAVEVGMIGIAPLGETTTSTYNIFDAAYMAVSKTIEMASLIVVVLVKLIQRIIPADTIGGPIMIFQMASKQAASGFLSFMLFIALININLGVFNLLPIPILDGGLVFYLIIEAIRKKPLSERAIAVSQKVGLALLILLMAFAMYNDIHRLFTGTPLP